MLVVGGSLAAGVQNGGLYREAQLTAYPNLLANQMGINLKQPLFDTAHYNGSGYKILIRDNGLTFRYTQVTNHLAYVPDSRDSALIKYTEGVDNLALPFFNPRSAWKDFNYYASLNLPSTESQNFIPFFKRLLPDVEANDGNTNYLSYLRSQITPDFLVFDVGMDGHLRSALVGGDPSQLPAPEEGDRADKSEFAFLSETARKGSKGIAVNIPDVMDLPYFKLYTLKRLQSLCPECKLTVKAACGPVRPANQNDVLLPGEKIESLFSGKSDNEVLGEREVLSVDENCDETIGYRQVSWYNEYYVKYIAEKNNFALLDLYSLYKKINSGDYITDDGVLVDPTFPNGNFYSDDAIHPTGFGQAVIANECIKAVNARYGSKIPLLTTASYLKK
ncbi:hypothetical protein [Dyadobacter sp. Leaf189]|uniref:hypothetical protein n=1 Tax=Dyadobacter sp. Leaf189 TaxID=1736295 RepID=UPI0006F2F105|nr:hypothetical protein [Dyadobacter sp. Leaf189]KQS31033.1 hypothetical protein ASG33_11780 [Dyadobacter sp. Leaf189]